MCTKNIAGWDLPINVYNFNGTNFTKGRYQIKPSESEWISLDDANKDISNQSESKSLVGINL